jgi:hypothetical protein
MFDPDRSARGDTFLREFGDVAAELGGGDDPGLDEFFAGPEVEG